MNKIQISNQLVWSRYNKVKYFHQSIKNPSKDTILELGPNLSPVFRKENFKVSYLETVDKTGLIQRANKKNISHHLIPEIDFIFNADKGMLKSLPDNIKFDYLCSSHVIEHIPNFIQHLIDVEFLLNENGEYLIISPDKKYTFDHLRPFTTVGEFLSRHKSPNDNLSFSSKIDSIFYSTKTLEEKGNWNKKYLDDLNYRHKNRIDPIKSIMNTKKTDLKPWYGHYSVFTPLSFYEIVSCLNQIGLCNLKIVDIKCTNNMDFIRILRKSNLNNGKTIKEIKNYLKEVRYFELTKEVKCNN